jgi:hypothetical protein
MAAKTRRAPRTRTHLAALKSKLARKGISTDGLIVALEREYPEVLRAEAADIMRIGLVELANETFKLRTVAKNNAQLEMFAEYGTGSDIVLRVTDKNGRVTKICKAVDAIQLAEGDRHVAEHTRPRRQRVPKSVTELARLLKDVRRYGESETSTIGECWKAKQQVSKKS